MFQLCSHQATSCASPRASWQGPHNKQNSATACAFSGATECDLQSNVKSVTPTLDFEGPQQNNKSRPAATNDQFVSDQQEAQDMPKLNGSCLGFVKLSETLQKLAV